MVGSKLAENIKFINQNNYNIHLSGDNCINFEEFGDVGGIVPPYGELQKNDIYLSCEEPDPSYKAHYKFITHRQDDGTTISLVNVIEERNENTDEVEITILPFDIYGSGDE